MITNPFVNRITALVVLLAVYAAGYAGGRDQATLAHNQHPACNVIECIWAHSLTDAKAKAAIDWMPWWQEMEWLNPENVNDPENHV